jgi:hypothetical protein
VTALHSALAAGIVLTTGLLVRSALASHATPERVTRSAREHALGGAR